MKIAPCYDVANKRDCPDRQWCKTVGRSKCSKWVEYERLHSLELSEAAKLSVVRCASVELARSRRDHFLKKYTRGIRRMGDY